MQRWTMRRWLALSVMVALLGAAAFAWTRGRPDHPGVSFARAPAAAQGAPEAEALVAPVSDVTPADREARRFNRLDKDRDASITREEYFLARRKAYAKLDTDGDGKLSFDEYTAKAVKKFTAADANHDGKLAAPEFATTATVRKPRSQADCPPVDHQQPRDEEG